MKNRTATECWNILSGELDSAVDSYIPMKKQWKRSKKKHLSKEAFRKMRYKQNMWRVYKHTGKDKDYEVYKEALNAATNEVTKVKRNFEHKLARGKILVVTCTRNKVQWIRGGKVGSVNCNPKSSS